jgi:nondiscriminating glutamyl-tRNA synthetase
MSVRTRFAPSPTGYLHIGGVRTALFNWLLAKRHGGSFILRIDDTDLERNKPEALRPILDGFRWLGIHWDEGPEVGGPHGPYRQSEKLERYKQMAMMLVETGHAYPDTTAKEELDAARKAAEAAKKPYIHRGRERDWPIDRRLAALREQSLPVRLKVPVGQKLELNDLIKGTIEWQTEVIGDPVILRPNGLALYNFATVIDDIDLKVTHIIRAEEHLTNTNVQMLVYQAFGAAMPRFAHVPVVCEPNSRKKLSKRDMKKFVTPEVRAKLRSIGYTDAEIDAKDDLNPATVAYYREMGYLPAALVNYLGRLGWSLDEKSEYIPVDQMIANFSLDRVKDSAASFDPDKLYWLAGEYMRLQSVEERIAGVIPYLQRAKLLPAEVSPEQRARVKLVVEACGDRLKLYSDILTYGAFFFAKDPTYDAAALKKRVFKEGMPDLLKRLAARWENLSPFDQATLEADLQQYCQESKLKPADLNHAMRVATTGVAVGPGLFDCLTILGREETLRRLGLALSQVVD